MNSKITRTIVQKIDPEGYVISETVTTVEEHTVEQPTETYGMYL